jgi:hypothetical protein
METIEHERRQLLKRFPEWFVKDRPRPATGRYCFTTWNYFSRDSPLVPAGLVGPVTLQTDQPAEAPSLGHPAALQQDR